jgi:uncharacterized membrane protein (Fun14 family)
MHDLLTPILATLGFGGLVGFVTGIFAKQSVRLVGCILGLVFVLMQLMAYYGMASWHWNEIAKHAMPATQHAGAFFWKVVRYNLPFSGGFATGFYMAWRSRL